MGTVALWAILAAAAVPPGLAAPEVRAATTITLEFGAGEVCDFPVRIVAEDAQVQRTTRGTMAVTGQFRATVTNLSSGASRNYNISGPGMEGGRVLVGPSLVIQPVSVGEPFLLYIQGRVVFNEQGQIESISGNVTDVCEQLS